MKTTDIVLAFAAGLLLASMFLGWFRHYQAGQLSGIGILFPSSNGNLLIVLSGWGTSGELGAVAIVLAGMVGGQLLAAWRGFRRWGAYPGLVVAAGGLLAAGLIVHLLLVPPDVYTEAQPGAFIGLAAAVACVAAGWLAAAGHGARLSAFDPRRLELPGFLAAMGGTVLLVSMSLGWYSPRKYFGGSMPGYTPPDSLSPWAAEDPFAYLLAAVAVTAIALWLIRGLGVPRHRGLASATLALAGGVGAIMVLDRIGDPHSAVRNLYLFDQLNGGIYWSLAGCVAVTAGACWTLVRLSWREFADEGRQAATALGLVRSGSTIAAGQTGAEAGRRLPAPLIGGAGVALLIAALLADWSPLISAIVVIAFAIGFTLKRWWLVPLPMVIAIGLAATVDESCSSATATDCDTSGLAAILTLFLGVVVCVTVLVGVIAARLSERVDATSLRRRSS